MRVKLGERMVARGLITTAARDEALDAQMAYGARLGTNLVELFHIDLDVLAGALAEHFGLPAALGPGFAAADPTIQQALPAEVAARLHAVPLARQGGVIVVAVADPLADEALDELIDHLGGPLALAIAPEMRLLYHLEKAYGVQRTNRFRRVQREGTARDDRRAYVRTLSDDAEPEPPSRLARIAVKKLSATAVTGQHELGDDSSTLDGALRAMRRTTSRDRIAEAAVGAMASSFDDAFSAGMVLSLRRDVLFGWRGFVRDADRHLIEAVAIPTGEPSLFHKPVAGRHLYAGRPPGGGLPIDHRLWLLLRTGPPTEVVVIPIELRDRIIGVLYAQTEAEIPPEAIGGLAELAQGLAAAFDRLLRNQDR